MRSANPAEFVVNNPSNSHQSSLAWARYWIWPAALLSGLLLTLSLPPVEAEWLCWLALTPLIAAIWLGISEPSSPAPEQGRFLRLRRFFHRPAAKAGLLGYASGLVFFWMAFHWLSTVTGIGWFILAFYMSLYPALWGAAIYILGKQAGDFTRSFRNLRIAAVGAAVWVALEWVRGWLFSGFGWNNVGTALYANIPFIQIVEYTGVGGLSFLCVLTNLIAVITVKRFIQEIRTVRVRPHWDFSLTMILIVGVFLFGVKRLATPLFPETQPLKVAAIQPNVDQIDKVDFAKEKAVFERLTFLTESALAWEPQLLLWPEAATVRGLYDDSLNFSFVHDIGSKANFNFLFGSVQLDPDQRCYNIAVLISKQGESFQHYRKMHLVPFGEYIPFRNSFPLFAWMIGDLVPADYTPGAEPLLFRLSNPELSAAPLICFEDTLGELTRRFVVNGAQLLVNVTNDGWFLESVASRQHLANAVFRAVENRRPLVRSANTGVTAFVDAHGRVTSSLDRFCEGILTSIVDIPPENSPLTFYSQRGEVFSKFCALYTVVFFGIGIVRRSRNRHTELLAR